MAKQRTETIDENKYGNLARMVINQKEKFVRSKRGKNQNSDIIHSNLTTMLLNPTTRNVH
jgi:hypothetical protein